MRNGLIQIGACVVAVFVFRVIPQPVTYAWVLLDWVEVRPELIYNGLHSE